LKVKFAQIIIDQHKLKTGEDIHYDQISFMLSNSRSCEVIFVFLGKKSCPTYIAKISNNESIKKNLENEYDILNKTMKLKSSALKQLLPVPIYCGEINGHKVIIEEACRGLPLNQFICRNKGSLYMTEKLFSKVTNCLVELHQNAYPQIFSLRDSQVERNFSDTVNLYKKKQGVVSSEEEYVEAIFRKLKINRNISLPLVLQHRDFASWNMLYDERTDTLSILDWEYAYFLGMPLLDLFNFFVIYKSIISGFERSQRKVLNNPFSIVADNPLPNPQDFIEMFYDETWRSSLAKKYIYEYCRKMSINHGLIKFLFSQFILRHLYYIKDFLSIFLNREKSVIF